MSSFKSTILITGGTLGLGYWTAFEAAKQFPTSKIIIASRSNADNADQTLNRKLKSSATSEQVEWMKLDLASTSAVREFVNRLSAKSYLPISQLILNAGLQFWQGEVQYSPDGVESTFAINHVGHSLLFFLLKPYLTNDARIVITSSGTHDPAQKTPFQAVYESADLLAHPTDKTPYSEKMKGGHRYATTKLANVLFTYAPEKRLKQARDEKRLNWTVAAFDPGLMPGTGLGRDAGPVLLWIAMHIMTRLLWLLKLVTRSNNVHLPQESGKSQADLAAMTGEQAHKTSGTYYSGQRQIPSATASHDIDKQDDLWRWTVDFLAKDEAEKKAFETF